jgi:PAS domain S-box-containing protein
VDAKTPARLERVLDQVPDGIFILDAAGRCEFVNRAAAAASNATPEELRGQVLWEHAPFTAAGPVHQAVLRAHEEGRPQNFDFERDDGVRKRWYEYSVLPVADGVAVHFRDITARKSAEAELRKFLFMVDASSAEAYLVRPDGALVYVNEAAARSLGYTREELLRLGVSAFDPDFGPRFRSHFEALKSGPLPPFETVHVAKDGRRIAKEIRSVYLRIGDEEFVCGFGMDITDRVEAERHWARGLELERAMRDIDRAIIDGASLDASLDLICRATLEAGFALAWVGLAEPDGTVRPVAAAGAGRDYALDARIRWDDSPEGQGPTGKALRSGTPFMCESISHDPRFVPWRASAMAHGFGSSVAYPLISATREVLGSLNVYRDHEGTFTEDELRSLSTFAGQCTLAVVTARREQALHDTERQLAAAQRLEAVGTLAGGVAHDFNNLLTGIIGFAQLLRSQYAGDPKTAGDIDEILHSANRASTLTRQLLAFARRQVIAPVRVDLNVLVDDFLKLLRRVLGEHIEVSVEPAAGLSPALVDPGQLEQVLMNLCVNARDAMPRGGHLRIETFEHRENHAPEHEVGIRVVDDGIGIPKPVRERIFEPFFTTKPQGRGSGLGLAVSYGIVRQHGGTLSFRSEEGKGTTFEIRLPAVEGAAEPMPRVKRRDVRGGSETILVADDEQLLRDLIRRILGGLGYRVLIAADGAEALDLFRAHPEVDLVLLDAVMPRTQGMAAYAEMKALRPGVRVLIMSGYAEEAVDQSLFALAGTPFIAKPFEANELARKVRDVLDGPTAPVG